MRRASLTRYRPSGGNNISAGITASKAGTSSSASVTTTAVTTQASGSTFFVAVSWYNSATGPTVTDNKSNTYTQIGTTMYNATDLTGMAIFSVKGNGGTGHTFTATAAGSGAYVAISVLEIKGSTGVLDGHNQSAASAGAGPFSSGNITTTNANDIIVGAGFTDTETYPQAVTMGGLATADASVPCTANSLGIAVNHSIVTATGTYNSTATSSPNGTYGGAMVAAFKST